MEIDLVLTTEHRRMNRHYLKIELSSSPIFARHKREYKSERSKGEDAT